MRVHLTSFILLFFLLTACVVAEEPTSLAVSPPDGAIVTSEDLIVSASLSGPSVPSMDLAHARLFIDGQEMTERSLRTERVLTYRPPVALGSGTIQARVEFANGLVKSWAFQVKADQDIREVSHTAKGTLSEYEEFTVTMRAKPGQKAGFKVGPDDKTEHPLIEESPGVYRGTYVVGRRDYFLGEPIIGLLHLGSRVESKLSANPVTLFGQLFRVVILSPKSGVDVPNNFDIKGRTRPGCRVTFVPDLSFSRNTRAPNTRGTGGDASFEARADDQGFFTVNYGVPISLPNLSVVMSVFATTPQGERSVPVILRYHF